MVSFVQQNIHVLTCANSPAQIVGLDCDYNKMHKSEKYQVQKQYLNFRLKYMTKLQGVTEHEPLLYPLSAFCLPSVETRNEEGELLCVNQFSTFVMGAGGFGGKRSSPHAKVQLFYSVHLHFVFLCKCWYMCFVLRTQPLCSCLLG